MFVTELTFQFEMSELKFDALQKMQNMLVTELTSHLEMSELKVDAPANSSFMYVTNFTHQVPISPYVVRVVQLGSVSHPSLM